MKRSILIISLLSFIFSNDYLQWDNHPELEWRTIETDHFVIHFHQGTERSAREAAEVAEYVYQPIVELYDFIPKSKTDIVIQDVDDYSNGAAFFFENRIEIWARPLDYDLRGSHRWMQGVISHEFTHIVQLGKSMKYNPKMIGVYLQNFGYEDEKREDVLYGYPNEIMSTPISSIISIPMWLAEGTAQHMYNDVYFDYWDSIRDMLLRDRVLNNNLFTFKQMNSFGKCGMGNELVYNFGFSLVEYINAQYGENTLKEISSNLSKPFNYSINKSIKEVIGIDGEQLYINWRNHLEDVYNKQDQDVSDPEDYILLESTGITNINPKWSPNGKKIAYLSDKDNDRYGRTDLFIYEMQDSTHKKIKSGVKSTPAWINDSLLVYSKISKPDKNGSKYFDLYSYDLVEEEEKQLTFGSRIYSPIYNPKTKQIIGLNTYDGTSNVIVGNEDFSEYDILTDFNDGMYIYSISTYQENYIIDAVINHERNLYLINSKTGKLDDFIVKPWDIRDQEYIDNMLIYSDDKQGIYNLYMKFDDTEGYITDVIGGTFNPDISIEGKIVFSIYQNGGYKLALLDKFNFILDNFTFTNNNIKTINDKIGEEYYYRPSSILINTQFEGESKEYQEKMTGPFFVPKVMFDYNTFKPGFYFFDNDVLRKITVFGSLSYNTEKDVDFYLLFDYNKNYFTYYFNFYWISRHVSRAHKYKNQMGQTIDNIIYDVDYIYHIFSADIGSRFKFKGHKFWIYYTFSSYRQFYDVVLTQHLPDEYLDDFFAENEDNISIFDNAYDYYRGHSLTIKHEIDKRKKNYLYNMLPYQGYLIKSQISFENNNLFEEFKINQDYGGFFPYLAAHNTERYVINGSKYFRIDFKNDKFISVTSNILLQYLSNQDVDDFVYFFGGGLPGMKGYTFYEPTLQGPSILIMSNEFRFPLFLDKAIGYDVFSINSMSAGFIHQLGKADNAKIISNWSSDLPENLLMSLLDVDNLSSIEFDALDRENKIPDHYEDEIFVDVYSQEFNIRKSETMTEIKKRYNKIKQSIGIELRLYGFLFYTFPTAITYEFHKPLNDSSNKEVKHYLKLLFDFQ